MALPCVSSPAARKVKQMKEAFSFVVPGPALPWQRVGRGKGGNAYTPKEQREYQELLQWHALAARPHGWNLDARYLVWLYASFPDAAARDVDNIQKQVGDALQKLVWSNDSRIVAWRPVLAPVSMKPELGVAVEIVDPARARRLAREVQGHVQSLLSASGHAKQGVAPAGRKVRRAW